MKKTTENQYQTADRHSQQSEHLTLAANIKEPAIYLKELVESKPELKREWKY